MSCSKLEDNAPASPGQLWLWFAGKLSHKLQHVDRNYWLHLITVPDLNLRPFNSFYFIRFLWRWFGMSFLPGLIRRLCSRHSKRCRMKMHAGLVYANRQACLQTHNWTSQKLGHTIHRKVWSVPYPWALGAFRGSQRIKMSLGLSSSSRNESRWKLLDWMIGGYSCSSSGIHKWWSRKLSSSLHEVVNSFCEI